MIWRSRRGCPLGNSLPGRCRWGLSILQAHMFPRVLPSSGYPRTPCWLCVGWEVTGFAPTAIACFGSNAAWGHCRGSLGLTAPEGHLVTCRHHLCPLGMEGPGSGPSVWVTLSLALYGQSLLWPVSLESSLYPVGRGTSVTPKPWACPTHSEPCDGVGASQQLRDVGEMGQWWR